MMMMIREVMMMMMMMMMMIMIRLVEGEMIRLVEGDDDDYVYLIYFRLLTMSCDCQVTTNSYI